MTNKHTPGPWTAGNNDGYSIWTIHAKKTLAESNVTIKRLAEVIGDSAETDANACLIAAAPELLKTLKIALWMLGRDYIDDQKMGVIEKCEAAIAKATGEEQ